MNVSTLVYLEAAALVVLQLLDYKTTITAIKAGAVEKGAATKSLIGKLGLKTGVGVAKLLGIAIAVGLAVVYSFSPSPAIPAVMGGVIAYYVWVVVQNHKNRKP